MIQTPSHFQRNATSRAVQLRAALALIAWPLLFSAAQAQSLDSVIRQALVDCSGLCRM